MAQAPRWFRNFSEWRWAPFVALLTGALAFIALVVLLIPIAFETPPHIGSARSSEVHAPLLARALPAQLPTRAAFSAFNAPSIPDVPERSVSQPSSPPSAPEPVLDEASPSAAIPPDFGANIADRGDRPAAPSPRAQR